MLKNYKLYLKTSLMKLKKTDFCRIFQRVNRHYLRLTASYDTLKSRENMVQD